MLVFAIFMLILAIGAFLLFNMLHKHYANDTESYRAAEKAAKFKRRKFAVPGIICMILALMMLVSGIRIIDETEIGVVRTFGEISSTIDRGLNIVNPITDTVSMFDLKVHKQERAFSSYTKDAQPIITSVEYQYELPEANVIQVAREYGTYESLEDKLGNMVEERVKVVEARYSAMPLLENRANLSAEVTAEVQKLEEIFPVNFTSVIVRDIDFSDAFEASVEAKMTAEQNALKAEQDKKTAVVKAEQQLEVAAIEAEANIARAKGEAEALEITRQALQNMPDTWIAQQYLEKWDGVLPQIMSDGANLMITPNM